MRLVALSPSRRRTTKSRDNDNRPPRHTTKSRASSSGKSSKSSSRSGRGGGDDDSPVVLASCYSSSNSGSGQQQQKQQQLSPRSRMKKSRLQLEASKRSLSLKRHPSSPSTASAYVHTKGSTIAGGGDAFGSMDGGQAAADALRHDLEEMGYDLNCESFITRNSGSSIAGDADERYAAPQMQSSVGSRKAAFFEESSSSSSSSSSDDESEDFDSETLSADVAALLLDSSSSEDDIADLLYASSSEDETIESTIQRKQRRNKFRLFGGGPRKQKHKRIDSHVGPSLTESNTTDDYSAQKEKRTKTNKKKKKDKSTPHAHNHRKGHRSTTTHGKKKAKKESIIVVKKNKRKHIIHQTPSSTEESGDTSVTDPVKVHSKGSSDSSLQKVSSKPRQKRTQDSSTSEETTSVAPDHEISDSKVPSKGGAPGALSMTSSAAGGRSNTPNKLMKVSSRSPSSAGLVTNTPSKLLRAPEKGENVEPVSTKTQNEAAATNDEKAPDAKAAAGQEAPHENDDNNPAVIRSPAWEEAIAKQKIKASGLDDLKIASVPSAQGFSLASLSTDIGVEQVFIDNMSVVNEIGAHSVTPDYIIDGNAADDERENEVKEDLCPKANHHVLGKRVGSPVVTRGGRPIVRKKSVRIRSPASSEMLHPVQEEEPKLRDEGEVEPWLEIDKTTGKPMVREQSLPTKQSSGEKYHPSATRGTGGLTDKGPTEDVGASSPDLYDIGVAPRDSPPQTSKSPRRLHRQIRSRSWNNKTQQQTRKTPDGKKAKIGARIGHFFKKGALPGAVREKNGGMVAIRVIEEDGGIDLKLLGKNERKEAHAKQHREGRPVPTVTIPPPKSMQTQKESAKDPHAPPKTRPASSNPSKSQEKNEAADILPSNSTILSEMDSTYNLLDKNRNVQLGCARVPHLATAVQTLYHTGCDSSLRQITGQPHVPCNQPKPIQMVRTRSAAGAALATSLCYQCNEPGTSNGIFYQNSDDRSQAGSLTADENRPLPPRKKFTGAASPKPLMNDIGSPREADLEGIEVPNLWSSTRRPTTAKGKASYMKGNQHPTPKKSPSNDSEITLDTISQLFGSYTSPDGKEVKTFRNTLEGKGKRGLKGLWTNGIVPKRTVSAPPVVANKALPPINSKPAALNLPPPPVNRKHLIDHPNAPYNNTNNRTKPPTKLPSSLRQPRHSVHRNLVTSSRNPATPKAVATTPVVAETEKDAKQMMLSPTGQIFKKQVSKPAAAPNNYTPRSDMAMAYPIEFNDDNCTLTQNSTGATAGAATAPDPPSASADRMRSMESIENAAQLRQVMTEVKKNRAESITPVVEEARSRSREKTGKPEEALADLLVTPRPTPPSSPQNRELVTPQSPLADLISENSWNEVHEAASLLSKAMSAIDSVKSEDTVNDADHLHKLLSEERDLGGVEHALHTLKKHADRMGLRESDLLIAAVRSEETGGSVLSATTGQISVRSMRSMTIGEELTEIFNMFIGRPSASKNRRSRSFLAA